MYTPHYWALLPLVSNREIQVAVTKGWDTEDEKTNKQPYKQPKIINTNIALYLCIEKEITEIQILKTYTATNKYNVLK